VQHTVKVLAVAVLVATVLVISSTVAFARPLRGGLPLQRPEPSQSFVCERLVGNHPRTLFRPDDPTELPTATCWLRNLGLEQASDVVPPVVPPT
jgi:hypothetical protein